MIDDSNFTNDFDLLSKARNFWTNGKYDRPHAAGENIVITVTGNVVGTKIVKVANKHRYICEARTLS